MIVLFAFFCAVFACAFWLYALPLGAVLYPASVCVVFGVLFLLADLRRRREKHRMLRDLAGRPAALMEELPEERTQDDRDYQTLIRLLREEQVQSENRMNRRYADMVDYYTVWAHQIKTPIAAMRLTLQNEDSRLSRRVSEELFRIEQYVEMVLVFLRLDADSTDYVIRDYDLDEIVKQALRKYSGQFIGRKLALRYKPLQARVITDEKWLLFVLEQVLSNAVKYTPEGGSVSIELEEPKTLVIRDTGIGIAAEDLPRIFEKGFTGYNGRAEKKSTGLGLYLCKTVAARLSHRIWAESEPGKGTSVYLDLRTDPLAVE